MTRPRQGGSIEEIRAACGHEDLLDVMPWRYKLTRALKKEFENLD
jgi:hypothetical protein